MLEGSMKSDILNNFDLFNLKVKFFNLTIYVGQKD